MLFIMEIIEILKIHANKYPQMTPQDAVKLIYQNEFGGGHLIKDKETCLKRMYLEFESIEKCDTEEKHEYIGNNVIRVNLKALKKEDLINLCESFITSAKIHKGSTLAFKYKLKLLWENFDSIGFKFTKDQLKEYLKEYKSENYPMVSHSKVYNEFYKPSYRIVQKDMYFPAPVAVTGI